MRLFGFQITKDKPQDQGEEENLKAIAPQTNDDGAITIQTGSYYGTYVDLDGTVRNEVELITKYREMSQQAECEDAIDDIIDEAIIPDNHGECVSINLDDVEQPDSVKKLIKDEFSYILKLLNFGNFGQEIFRKWYVDGRLFYQIIIDEENPALGIQELRYIDPRRIRKIREIQKTKDPATGMEIIRKTQEYYLYNERGMTGAYSNLGQRIAIDTIANVNSGLLDSRRAMVISYLHKAIKPLNNLRMEEDALVIYRVSRSSERRVFYIDVGTMPTIKAEQYLRDTMVKYRNKLIYDSTTGDIMNDRKYQAMTEDFWLPRREGSQGTQIDTLSAGENLGKIEDVEYFEKKLYRALKVPYSRAKENSGFSLGKSTEITRDEIKFGKFVDRLRNKFSSLFDDLLRVQCTLKNICLPDEWDDIVNKMYFDYMKDNNFEELKEIELYLNRFQTIQMVDPFVGKYVSAEWVRKKILRQTQEEMEEINDQIANEHEIMQANAPKDADGNPLPVDQNGIPIQPPPGQDQQQGQGQNTLDSDQIDQNDKSKQDQDSSYDVNPKDFKKKMPTPPKNPKIMRKVVG